MVLSDNFNSMRIFAIILVTDRSKAWRHSRHVNFSKLGLDELSKSKYFIKYPPLFLVKLVVFHS